MPCDSVRITTVKLANASVHILADALRSLGIEVFGVDDEEASIMFRDGNYAKGEFRVDERSIIARDINAVKRAYSAGVIRKMAKTYGGDVIQEGPTKLRLKLRR